MATEPALKKARTSMPVVLGTASKWRRALFDKHFPEHLGSEFMAADIDEKAIRAERPEDMTVAIAKGKADALLPALEGKHVLLVTMDQVVCCEGAVREKPESEAQARQFLESYRQGSGATCVNGMVVHNTQSGKRVIGVESATLYWKPFPDSIVDRLLQKGEIFTSAGGFTVEDPELAPFLDRRDGPLDVIEGLPVRALREMLLRAAAPSVSHVIFDMDGLLLDTETAYTVAQQEIVGRWGKIFTWEIKAKMMGKKAVEAAQICIDDLELGKEITAEEFVKDRERILDELFAKSPLLPGVEKLIRHLHKHGIPMAIATGSHRRHFELKTSLHKELFDLVQHVVTGDQVARSKPDPLSFTMAADLFASKSLDPAKILVFEDAPNGVEAALRAGMQVCHVPDANLSPELRGNSFCELRSLEDFKPEEWGLPAF